MTKKANRNKLRRALVQFSEKQGFYIAMTLCIAVITGTALWTRPATQEYTPPTPPVAPDIAAAQLMQQSIANAATPSPTATIAPTVWGLPLKSLKIVQGYSADTLVQSGVTGVWRLHDAIDLQTASGEPVWAIIPGIVADCGVSELQGAWVTVNSTDGHTVHYAGMKMLSAVQIGDKITLGQTLGFAGNDLLDEADLEPHLHLRITKNGVSVNPEVILAAAAE